MKLDTVILKISNQHGYDQLEHRPTTVFFAQITVKAWDHMLQVRVKKDHTFDDVAEVWTWAADIVSAVETNILRLGDYDNGEGKETGRG